MPASALSRRSLFTVLPALAATSAVAKSTAWTNVASGDDPLFMSATKLARLIREKQISATEVIKLHIARIEATSPRINAVVATCFERAL